MISAVLTLACVSPELPLPGNVLVPDTSMVIPVESATAVSPGSVGSGPHACPVVLGTPMDGGWDLATPALADSALVGPNPEVSRIHLGFGADASHDLIFSWETTRSTVATRVQIGTTQGVPTWTIPGASFELGGKRIHVVRACGFDAATTLWYQVGGGGAWSDEHAVTTAPLAGGVGTVRFAVAGDSRGSPSTWGAIATAAAAAGAEFVVFTGDAVSNGTLLDDWDAWFDAAEPALAEMPLVFVQGNHEGNDQYFYGLFPSYNDQATFGVDYGPLHFAVVNDTAYGSWTPTAMAAWLAADLSASSRAWRVPAFHRPIVSSSNPHGEDATNKAYLLPAIDAASAPVVLNGHAHNYERSYPVRGMAVSDAGTVHIVTGGAGAPLYTGSYGRSYTAVELKTQHWLLVDASETTWTGTAYDLAGNEIDRFTLTR